MATVAFSRPISSYSIRRLLPSASFVGCGDIRFRQLATHSADCQRGTLFVALPGSRHHGNDFVEQACEQGASGIMLETPRPDLSVPQCIVGDVRKSYGLLCHEMQGRPGDQLKTIGVTGTNGKTTVTWLLRSILNCAGSHCGLLGTIENDDSRHQPEPATLTTPDAGEIASWLQRMAFAGATHVAMEVSSHALTQQRLAGMELESAIITNITQDHLDYHQNLESYAAAKREIINYCKSSGQLVINGDDARLRTTLQEIELPVRPIQVGFDDELEHWIQVHSMDMSGSEFQINLQHRLLDLRINLPGRFNIMNAALAAVTASYHGCSDEQIRHGLEHAVLPPGRLQQVETDHEFSCYVDYAHTPDAIENIISTMKPLTPGRVICLFGAGGNRDRGKRKLMAQAALQADLILLTADNSRHESTDQILGDLLSGFPADRETPHVEPDRRKAIKKAVSLAQPGDCLLVLGKGHEQTQQIGELKIPFDDVAELQTALQQTKSERGNYLRTA